MKKFVSLLAVILFTAAFTIVSAQKTSGTKYTTAIGVKLYPGGITVKQALMKNASLEGIAYFWNGLRVTGLYEIHYNIEGIKGLRWYAGAGAHVAFNDEAYLAENTIGLDGVLGLDLKIKNVPLNLSLDWQPSFDFRVANGFNGGFGGLSVRYVLN